MAPLTPAMTPCAAQCPKLASMAAPTRTCCCRHIAALCAPVMSAAVAAAVLVAAASIVLTRRRQLARSSSRQCGLHGRAGDPEQHPQQHQPLRPDAFDGEGSSTRGGKHLQQAPPPSDGLHLGGWCVGRDGQKRSWAFGACRGRAGSAARMSACSLDFVCVLQNPPPGAITTTSARCQCYICYIATYVASFMRPAASSVCLPACWFHATWHRALSACRSAAWCWELWARFQGPFTRPGRGDQSHPLPARAAAPRPQGG